MSALTFEYREGGVWFPNLDLWLDAGRAKRGSARVFVSHAHSDHTARHREIIATSTTARFLEARLGGGTRRVEHLLPWREPRQFETAGVPWSITLFPAGHILGSAMARLEAGGETVLYTGDFKLAPSPAAEPCEPCPADHLIMETTFGRPAYVFPSREAVASEIVAFVQSALSEGVIPVLLGYSLGKAQELLWIVAAAGIPVALHPAVSAMTRVYLDSGGTLPACCPVDAPSSEPRVLLCPPGGRWTDWLPAGARARTAVATGWAVDRSARFRYGVDAAFPLSDHADFPGLLSFVSRVSPRCVHTLHGFAAEFAARLRARGWEARSLSEDDQLELALGVDFLESRKPEARKPGAGGLGRP